MSILTYKCIYQIFGRNITYPALRRVPSPYLSSCVLSSNTASSYDREHSENMCSSEAPVLYPDHIPTTTLQKFLLTVGSAAMALADPYRDDMVAVLGETTGSSALKGLLFRMQENSEGREILRDRPRINSSTVQFQMLKELPPTTFGNVYATFMEKHGITSDSRKPVHFVDDVDSAYLIQRYRETHDLVHALLDMPTNMLGEVAVKWVEALQTRLPMCIGAALMGPLRLKPKQREKYQSLYLPWAIRCGLEAKFLLGLYYEKRWTQPIDDLRRELGVPSLPT